MGFSIFKSMIRFSVVWLVLAAIPQPALAALMQLDFTAADFGVGAPVDPVTGTITYDAASPTTAINSISSISLNISGHVYTLAETTFAKFNTLQFIGGAINGANSINSGTDDFVLEWDLPSKAPKYFYYATTAHPQGIWRTQHFSTFTIEPVATVPIPPTMLLLASGLIGVAGLRRKYKK